MLDDLLKMLWGALAMWAATREAMERARQERDNYKTIAEAAGRQQVES